MFTCTELAKYAPIISAGIGFCAALIVFTLKEWLDRKSKRREALYCLLFFIKSLQHSISARTPQPLYSSGFDEALKRLAAARLPFYSWDEMVKLSKYNADISGGKYTQLSYEQPILDDLNSIYNSLSNKLSSYR